MSQTGPTIVRRAVPQALRGIVAGMIGFDEVAPPGGRLRVQPSGSLHVLELSLASPLHIRPVRATVGAEITRTGFLAGLMPGPVRTVFFDRHTSVQIYLTPLGTLRLFGVPGRETAGLVIPLADVMPDWADGLSDQLAGTVDWPGRFDIMIDALVRQAAAERPVDPLAKWAWSELRRTGGQVRVADLAYRSGWSVRHLGTIFGAATGVSLKQAAQVIRFERIHAELDGANLSELAAGHGLADQSHLCRLVRRYAGESPLALARANRPTAFTAMGSRPG